MATFPSRTPPEIVDLIADHLDLPDLRSLRLVCRDLHKKATAGSRFRGFCDHKTVELRKSDLETMGAWLSQPGAQQYLEHLTITGVLLVTKGLERIVRDGTRPANLRDPCCLKRDRIGNRTIVLRVTASPAEVEEARSQLSDMVREIDSINEDRAAGADMLALANLFGIIKKRCRAAGLKSLTLNLGVRREPTTLLSPALGAPFRQCWEAAQHVLGVTMEAWHRSDILIQNLDVFSNTEACGVETHVFAALEKQLGFQKILAGVEAFSLSISNRLLPLSPAEQLRNVDRDEDRTRGLFAGPIDRDTPASLIEERTRLLDEQDNISGLADCLRWMKNLEELSVHDYWLVNTFDTAAPALAGRKALLSYTAANAPLSTLRKLSLRNANVEIDALQTLLKNSPRLTSLTMREVTLTPRNKQGWGTVFAYLTSHDAKLTYIYLDNLFEETEQQHCYVNCFTPGTEPGYSISTGETASARFERLALRDWTHGRPSANGWNAFELDRRERVLRGIAYHLNSSYTIGSVQNSEWLEQRRLNDGPLGD